MTHLTAFPNQDRLRVLAADSTSMGTQLLVEALAREGRFQMIESPSTEAAILALIQREKPHVAVISAKLGEKSSAGPELVRNIRALSPVTRVIILLDASERSAVTGAFRTGAQGVFCRTEPFRLLAKCIQCVHLGQVWASSHELQFILEALAQPNFADFPGIGAVPLSAREIDVVRCVAEGLTNRGIAQRLKLTEHTVKNYMFRIFDKLGVSSRLEVLLYALGKSNVPGTTATRRPSPALGLPARAAASPAVTIRKIAT